MITSFCIIIPILFNVFCTKYDYFVKPTKQNGVFLHRKMEIIKKVREQNPTRKFFQKKISSFYLLVCCFLFTFTTE